MKKRGWGSRLILLGAVLLAVAAISVWQLTRFSQGDESSRKIVIEQAGSVVYEEDYPGQRAGEAEGKQLCFRGSAGEYVVEVQDGKARMLSAHCPDKLCMRQGWTDNPLNPVICLPQKVVISIVKTREADQELDALVK